MTTKNTAHVFIRCTPEEKAAWEKAAQENGRSLNNWAKWICNSEAFLLPKKGKSDAS